MVLQVFEPRYVRMIERIIATPDPTFGMLCHNSPHGTLVRVTESKRLQGGRFLLTVLGSRRFRVVRTYEVDGYLSAQVVWAEDATRGRPESKPAPHRTATALRALAMPG